jgi:hypothetical protein
MAKLYGIMQGNRGEVTRTGSSEIEATIKNFSFAVSTHIADRGGGDKDIVDIVLHNLRTGHRVTLFHGSFAEMSDPVRLLQLAASAAGGEP